MIEIKPSNIKFDESAFNNFQKELGVHLPKKYIQFLEKYNGGTPEPNLVERPNEEVESFSIRYFFGVNHVNIYDLKAQYETYKGRIPSRNIPICEVEGGNIVCLNMDNGLISLWDHDLELMIEDDLPVNQLLTVARNFEAFLSLIKPYEYQEEDLAGYKIRSMSVDPDHLEKLKNDADLRAAFGYTESSFLEFLSNLEKYKA